MRLLLSLVSWSAPPRKIDAEPSRLRLAACWKLL
uniref:Uncharacterized protein n=1 Tax=Arundo donax TaxID=35708 RepID=A0A0A9AB85_ARUDO